MVGCDAIGSLDRGNKDSGSWDASNGATWDAFRHWMVYLAGKAASRLGWDVCVMYSVVAARRKKGTAGQEVKSTFLYQTRVDS